MYLAPLHAQARWSLCSNHFLLGVLRPVRPSLFGRITVHLPQLGGGFGTAPSQVFGLWRYCRPLDADADAADASVLADAVAAIVIKALSTARPDNDAEHAVIEGLFDGT